jgi:uncharacterized protein YndB with AHSA1/START domain
VALLKRKYKLSPWWQQGVTHGYELHIGRKAEGRNAKGEYSTMASRTLPVSVKDSWKFLNSEDGLRFWLKPMGDFEIKPKAQFEREGGIFGEVRTARAAERARLTWQDEDWTKPSILQIYLIKRAGPKSILAFQHDKLPSDRCRLEMRDYWKSVVDSIFDHFTAKSRKTFEGSSSFSRRAR